jgi:hypothetical protein
VVPGVATPQPASVVRCSVIGLCGGVGGTSTAVSAAKSSPARSRVERGQRLLALSQVGPAADGP